MVFLLSQQLIGMTTPEQISLSLMKLKSYTNGFTTFQERNIVAVPKLAIKIIELNNFFFSLPDKGDPFFDDFENEFEGGFDQEVKDEDKKIKL